MNEYVYSMAGTSKSKDYRQLYRIDNQNNMQISKAVEDGKQTYKAEPESFASAWRKRSVIIHGNTNKDVSKCSKFIQEKQRCPAGFVRRTLLADNAHYQLIPKYL